MGQFRDLMERHLKLSHLSERSQQAYMRSARRLFEAYPGLNPYTVEESVLEDYFIYLKERYAAGTLSIDRGGLRFFFTQVIPRPDWTVFDRFKIGKKNALRPCLTVNETWRLLNAIRTPHNKTILTIIYLCGLRLGEARSLQVGDIHSEEGVISVHRGKGSKNRKIPLPDKGLMLLREYWKTHRNPLLVFPALDRGRRSKPSSTTENLMHASTIQDVFKKAAADVNICKRRLSSHSLRHSYATHAIELGVPVEHVRIFLGHTNLATTEQYVHSTPKGLEDTKVLMQKLAEPLS
jgi:integrase